jgi:hypothetical protein
MNPSTITVEATLQPDGKTLQLDDKLGLPPGRVSITLQLIEPRPGPTMLEVLDRIHQEQQTANHKPLTEEEMAAEVARVRADREYEERWARIWKADTR